MVMSDDRYVPGRVFAVFPIGVDQDEAREIIKIEYGLVVTSWITPWQGMAELYSAIIRVPEGEEILWANRIGDHENIPVTGRIPKEGAV